MCLFKLKIFFYSINVFLLYFNNCHCQYIGNASLINASILQMGLSVNDSISDLDTSTSKEIHSHVVKKPMAIPTNSNLQYKNYSTITDFSKSIEDVLKNEKIQNSSVVPKSRRKGFTDNENPANDSLIDTNSTLRTNITLKLSPENITINSEKFNISSLAGSESMINTYNHSLGKENHTNLNYNSSTTETTSTAESHKILKSAINKSLPQTLSQPSTTKQPNVPSSSTTAAITGTHSLNPVPLNFDSVTIHKLHPTPVLAMNDKKISTKVITAHNDNDGTKSSGSPATLAITVIIVLTICIVLLIVTLKYFRGFWDKRQYSRVDFLIDGMYD